MKKSLLLFIVVITWELVYGKKVISAWDQSTAYNLFASNLYNAVAGDKLNDNVALSTAAIQCSMALAYYGAKGKTAMEMVTGLNLDTSNADDIVQRFSEFQQSFTRDNNLVNLFNRIYINENLEFKAKFKDVAKTKFNSDIEKADFHPPYNKRTAERINREVETKTNNKIKDILNAQQLDDLTEGVIVNALTFSAPWQKAFAADRTVKRNFFNGGRQTTKVDTMWTLNNFRYGEFSNLNAKVLELPYQNNDYSMIIILPNRKEGLRDLQQNLVGKNLPDLLQNSLSSQRVEVYLPKFSITYGLDLQEPFKKLGVTSMFTREGDFGNMYRMFVSHYINSATHKAYIEISENGGEAPLGANIGSGLQMFAVNKKFEVNHPFVFAVKYQNSIIMMGHVVNV